MPGWDRQLDRNRVRLAGAVVDEDDPGRVAEQRARGLRGEGAASARDERDLPVSEPFGRLPRPLFGSAAGPQRWRSTGLPSVPMTVADVDERAGRVRPGQRCVARSGSGSCRARAARRRRDSAGAKTCAFETAATEIASGAVPGEPAEPRPKSSRSLPAAITGTTPARGGVAHRFDHRVVRRVGLGAAAREVDDVHAVCDRRSKALRSRACRRCGRSGSGREDAVVADERARRDAREAAGRRMVGPGRRAGPVVAGGDARDVRAVGSRRVEGRLLSLSALDPGRRARRSPSSWCAAVALREARRVREPGRARGTGSGVDAVVDDADLHPLALLAGGGLQIGGADHRRAAVHRRACT